MKIAKVQKTAWRYLYSPLYASTVLEHPADIYFRKIKLVGDYFTLQRGSIHSGIERTRIMYLKQDLVARPQRRRSVAKEAKTCIK